MTNKVEDIKYCGRKDHYLPVSQFYLRKTGDRAGKRMEWCIQCNKDYHAERRAIAKAVTGEL